MAGGTVSSDTKVVQITNIAPQATKDQMQSLFGNIGKIEEIRLYPTVRDVSCPVQSRICYVKYVDSTCVPVAQHLTNTVFIDRALIIIPVMMIPDEYRALEMSKNGTIVPGLHKPDSKLPSEVINRLEGMPPNQVIRTYDPKLEQNFLPPYPPLPSHFDGRKVEEIRRTIIVWDANSEFRLDDLMDLFAKAGEVKYACWAEKDNKLFAMIEFCEQKSVIGALKLQGTEFKGGLLNVYHSTDAILKPEAKSNEAAQREIEEAMSIVKEAQNMISAAIDPVIGMLAKDKRRRSRSRSRERRRSRSRSGRRSRSRRRSKSGTRSKRSRSKSKRRSLSHGRRSSSRKRSPSRSKRSRSRSKRRSRSHSKKSHSRERRRRSQSRRRSASRSSRTRRSRSRAKKSRSVDRKRSFRKDEKSRNSRSRSKSRSKRSTSRSRSTRNKDSKSSKKRSRSVEIKKLKRIPEESIVRDYDAEEKIGIFEENRKSPSFAKSDNMDISNSP